MSGLVNFGLGQPLTAVSNMVAAAYENLTSTAAQILNVTRLSTSTGSDVDSFINDFKYYRTAAITATGEVTFTPINAATAQFLIIPGLNLKTADGTLTYIVATDTGNAFWNAGLGGYNVTPGTASITVPIAASAPGTAYNVQANTITLISGTISGGGFSGNITNQVGITNGVDAASDAQAKTGFSQYLNTRSQATLAAIDFAITSVQSNLTYYVAVNTGYRLGFVQIYVDDGTGVPPSTLLTSIYNAVQAVFAPGITFAVLPPVVVPANVVLTIYAANGYDKTTLTGPVAQAITSLINGLGVAVPLSYFQIAAVAQSIEGVSKIEGLTLNGSNSDIGNVNGSNPAASVHVNSIAVN